MIINFDTEIKIYNNIIKKNDTILSKFSSFFKTLTINGLKFIEKSKKSLEEFYIELKDENQSLSYIKCLINFYNGLNRYFDELKNIYQNIDNLCVNKINDFLKDFKIKNNEYFNDILLIDHLFKEKKANLEKNKNDYFNSAKTLSDHELKLRQIKNSEDFSKNYIIYEKYIVSSEQMKNRYLIELNLYNKSIGDLEKDYNSSTKKIYNEQKKKIELVYEIINNFKKERNNLEKSNIEILSLIDKLNNSKNIERDVGSFKDENNFCDDSEQKKRIMPENFLDYDLFKKNIEEEKEQNRTLNKMDKKYGITKMFRLGKKEDEGNKINSQKISELIQKIFDDKEKVNNEETQFLMDYLESNTNNHLTFLQILKEIYKDRKFIIINIEYNFNFLKNIIELIIDSNSNNVRELYDKYLFLIKLSENILYINKENNNKKFYLCNQISRLYIFSSMEFWINLMNFEIKMVTEEKIKLQKNKTFKGNVIEKPNNIYPNKFKGFFHNTNKNVESQIVYRKMFDDSSSKYCIEIIEKFIQHFSNFKLSKNISIEIIKEIQSKYDLDNIYYEYFVAEINSNSFSLKETQNDIVKNMNKNNECNYTILNEENSNDKKLNLIIYSINNIKLDFNDYINILKLNKEYYKILRKTIYKKVLLNYPNIEFDKKIKIWKVILDYDENKKLYNYQELKNNKIENSNNQKNIKIIDLDVARTFFVEEKEANQEKISRIFKALVEAIPGISYSQGMNYIGAFLLNLAKSIKEENDEEEAFYLLLGLFTSTKYGELFKNNLQLLKKFYFIFERLISIFIPELYNFFINNRINISCFITSWFITLFTNAYQHNNLKYGPKILIKIFDSFFFSGWNSIIITSILLIKNYESKIFGLSSEKLLYFLNNDIIKGKYFENENFDEFIHAFNNFKIDEKLINCLEKEFDIKSKNLDKCKNLRFQII